MLSAGELADLLALPFVQRMFLAGLLASISCGVIGSYVVVRRIVFITGGVSHTTFGGIGFAYFLQDKAGWVGFDPLYGAVLVVLGAAALLSNSWIRQHMREDSAIGVVWVVGMAVGVLLLAAVDRTKVLVQDPVSILFGNILLIQTRDLVLMGILVLVILVAVVLLFKELQIVTFDEEFARLSGVPVGLINFALLALVGLTIVVLIKVVGVVLVIAMVTVPAATAGVFTRGLRSMMVLATIVSVVVTTLGGLVSLLFDLPPGAVIVLLLAVVFFSATGIRALMRLSSRATT